MVAFDYELEKDRLLRRRKIAEALLASSQTPMGGTETVGGIAIRRSPLEGVAKVAQAYFGTKRQNEVDDEVKALGERQRGDVAAALRDYSTAIAPKTQITGSTPMDDPTAEGGAFVTETTPVSPQGKQAAAFDLLGRMGGDPRDVGKLIVADALKAPTLTNVDTGNEIVVRDDRGNIVARYAKSATPDTVLREKGSDRRADQTAGVTIRGQDMTDARTRDEGAANRGVTVRGQDMTDARTRSEGALSRAVTVRGQDMTDSRSRDALDQGKVTDTQRVAAGYADRMRAAEDKLGSLKVDGKPGVIESAAESLPGVGKVAANVVRSTERQQYRQAQEDWVRAKLRKESGAVIGDEEMDREIRTYFPQIGDSADVIAQKTAARRLATDAMGNAAGNAPSAYTGPERRGIPSTSAIDAELRRREGR